ncbi:MAG: shikimate dehydrogenase, partial [Bacteroidaceae bacterium]|nr:shikimate dehydrogenase [Bacteroidaceae bacterium]
FEIADIAEVHGIIDAHPHLRGLNVTIPYKEKVIDHLDDIDPEAKSIGAVNTIRITRQKGKTHLKGYNTDVVGFTVSIQPLLQPHHSSALVLGTGGASRAVKHGLQKLGVVCQSVSRRKSEFSLSYEELHAQAKVLLRTHTVIVNCTPCGMFPYVNQCPDIPYLELDERHLLFDLTYNPPTTLFMQKGAEQGATVMNGWEMLVTQAEESWKIWNE